AGDRVLAVGPGVGDGPDQFLVDVHRAAAHAGDHAGALQVQAAQAAEDHVAAGAGVLHHAQHFGVEPFDLGAFHDSQAVALHAGLQVVNVPICLRVRAGLGGR